MSLSYEAALDKLNNLQTNFQVLLAQRKNENGRHHPKVIFKSHKKVLESLDGGELKYKLSKIPLVHIAGTKGKGSTSAFVESVLRAKGYKTGLFTSPHLVSVCERIRINGKPVSENVFAQNFESIYNEIYQQKSEIPPAYFAFLTFVAFQTFAMEEVDVVVLEVGIGGRYCATSTYPMFHHSQKTGRVSCITALGFDHIRILGSTIEEIGRAKAGIFRENSVLISSPQKVSGAELILEQEASRYKSSKFMISKKELIESDTAIGIKGDCNRENAATAITATRSLMGERVSDPLDDIEINALAKTYWPGRSQVISHNLSNGHILNVFIDAAHTADSINQCVKWMIGMDVAPMGIVFNITGERDEKPILTALSKLKPTHIFLTPNRSHDVVSKDRDNRVHPVEKQLEKLELIKESIISMKMDCSVTIHTSMTNVLNNVPSELSNILITGSVHLIGSYFALRPDIPV